MFQNSEQNFNAWEGERPREPLSRKHPSKNSLLSSGFVLTFCLLRCVRKAAVLYSLVQIWSTKFCRHGIVPINGRLVDM